MSISCVRDLGIENAVSDYQSPVMGKPSFGQIARTHAVPLTEDETRRTLPSIIPTTQVPESMAWTKYGLQAWTVGWFWGGAAVEVAVHVQAELLPWLVPAMLLLMSRVSKYGPHCQCHRVLYAHSLYE
jgi:hypothetical protein